jgi:hypothetical protein
LFTLFYILFYFDGMQTKEMACNPSVVVSPVEAESKAKHRYPFTIVKDSRNRKVRGLWRRGERLYMQTVLVQRE